MTNIQSSISPVNYEQMRQRFNAGNLVLNSAHTPVIGGVLPVTAFGEDLNWDRRRPQIALGCDAPEFGAMVAALHNVTAVGMARAQQPDGSYLAAIAYENDDFGLYACFDPHSPTGRALLLDWQKHENMHITFDCKDGSLSNRQALNNSLIGKLLAAPGPTRRIRTSGRGPEPKLSPELTQQLQTMRDMAQAMGESKPRLFVMMVDLTTEMVRKLEPHSVQLH
jgi:hypothetical protein